MHSICKICISSFLVQKPRRTGKCMSKFTGNKLALYWSDYHSTLPPAVYGTPAAPRLTTLGFAPIWSFHHSARVVTHHYGVTLLANDTEHLSLCLLGVHRWSFFRKAPSQLELFDFWLGDKFFFYVYWMQVYWQIHVLYLYIFSPSLWLVFSNALWRSFKFCFNCFLLPDLYFLSL